MTRKEQALAIAQEIRTLLFNDYDNPFWQGGLNVGGVLNPHDTSPSSYDFVLSDRQDRCYLVSVCAAKED